MGESGCVLCFLAISLGVAGGFPSDMEKPKKNGTSGFVPDLPAQPPLH